ncbi:hypothetical protein GDO81_029830 [Engystomops pustulosus]|uniref:Secreted protein n=1 Tax=Engystomops pustulosus TaxID=76066 RepID=A0AAV6YCM0_ENGPU|nr:hypothetical protein GDO81_029830 [Engystomops pustulosus]
MDGERGGRGLVILKKELCLFSVAALPCVLYVRAVLGVVVLQPPVHIAVPAAVLCSVCCESQMRRRRRATIHCCDITQGHDVHIRITPHTHNTHLPHVKKRRPTHHT